MTKPSAAHGQPLVWLEGVGLYRDGRWLVRDMSLTVRAGEIVTMIGPNGSGKSTTAKLAIGIVKPTSGKCRQKAGLQVSYMPQHMPVDRTLPLSVRRFMHLTNRLDEDAMHAALVATGVEHLADAQVHQLSGGELQRVLLARAFARKPELLVLDEPVQGVDVAGETALYDLIARMRDDTGCGILLVSHDLHMVMAATDHVLCINGHICCEGSPSSVMNNAAYRQLFGNKSSLALYTHRHTHTHLPDGRVLPYAGEEGKDAQKGA